MADPAGASGDDAHMDEADASLSSEVERDGSQHSGQPDRPGADSLGGLSGEASQLAQLLIAALAKASTELRPPLARQMSGGVPPGVRPPKDVTGVDCSWEDYEPLVKAYLIACKVPPEEWGLVGVTCLTAKTFQPVVQALQAGVLVEGAYSWDELCKVMRAASFGVPVTEYARFWEIIAWVQKDHGSRLPDALHQLMSLFMRMARPLSDQTKISITLRLLPDNLRQAAQVHSTTAKEWTEWVPFWNFVQALVKNQNVSSRDGSGQHQNPKRYKLALQRPGDKGASTSGAGGSNSTG